MRIWLLSFALAATALACGSSDPATGATPEADVGAAAETSTEGDTATPADAAVEDSVASDTGKADVALPDAAGACNTLVNVADVVTTTQVAEAMPTFTGGAVAEGTYVITAITAYTGAGGATGPKTGTTMKQTMLLSGGKFEIVRSQNGAAEKRSSGNYSTSASVFTLDGKCPSPIPVPLPYESAGGVLKVSLGNTIKEVITYTKK